MKNKHASRRRRWARVSVSILCLTLLLSAAITVVKGQNTLPTVTEKRYQPELDIRIRDIHVMSVAFSPDGKTLASGSVDKTIKLWNVESGQKLKSLAAHSNKVLSVAFSPDGKTLASGSEDKTIKLWDVESSQEIKSFAGHASSVYSVAFSPDGRTLASGAWDSIIKLWNVETGEELKSLAGHTDVVRSVAFSPDGRTLASSYFNGTIKLWNVESGQEIMRIGQTSSGSGAAFSPDGKTIASTALDKAIKFWNVETGQEVKSITGQAQRVVSPAAFSPDGKTIASSSYDGRIKLWNVETGEEIKSLAGDSRSVGGVAFSPDGKFLVSRNFEAKIKLWDGKSGKLLATLTSLDKNEWVAVTPDMQFDASAGALKLMSFVVSDPSFGSEAITLDRLKTKHLTPGLLKNILLQRHPTGANEFSITLSPKLEIEQPQANSATLNVKLENRGGGIGRVEVRVDGREFSSDLTAGKISNRTIARATIPVTIPKDLLNAGANYVEVIACNLVGDVCSRERRFGLFVEPDGAIRGFETVQIDK